MPYKWVSPYSVPSLSQHHFYRGYEPFPVDGDIDQPRSSDVAGHRSKRPMDTGECLEKLLILWAKVIGVPVNPL